MSARVSEICLRRIHPNKQPTYIPPRPRPAPGDGWRVTPPPGEELPPVLAGAACKDVAALVAVCSDCKSVAETMADLRVGGCGARAPILRLDLQREVSEGYYFCWLVDWLIDWLIDWLVGWLVGWLVDWLIDWLIDWLLRTWSPQAQGRVREFVRVHSHSV